MQSLHRRIFGSAADILGRHPGGLSLSRLIEELECHYPADAVREALLELPLERGRLQRSRRGRFKLARRANEARYYAEFAEFISLIEQCESCEVVGGQLLGAGTPDVLGCAAAPPGRPGYPRLVIAGELKLSAQRLSEGLGQAFSYKQWAHKSYLALPARETLQLARAERLCLSAGVGLCVYTGPPGRASFSLRLAAPAGHPDMQLQAERLHQVGKLLRRDPPGCGRLAA